MNFYLAVFVLLLSGNLHAQKDNLSYHITGKLTDVKTDKKVFLSYRAGELSVKDSVISKKGKFTFKGKLAGPEPVQAEIELKLPGQGEPTTYEEYLKRDAQTFYLASGTTTIAGTDSIKTASVKGSKTQDEYLSLKALLKPLEQEMAPLSEKAMALYKEGKERDENLGIALQAIRKRMDKVQDNFVLDNPDSYVSLNLVADGSGIIDVETFEPLLNGLSPAIRESSTGKKLQQQLTIAKRTAVGKPAPEFVQNNTEGVPVSLASFKGKYVLVDFWASWCGPCRAENPHVVKAYNQFRDRNFEIIGVSLDDKKDAWLKAIKDDSLSWMHVSDLQGWKNQVAQDYAISAVPQNLLLDPNGIIIAKNLRGEALGEKLASVLKIAPPKGTAIIKVKMENPKNYPMFFPYNKGDKWQFDSVYVMEGGYKVYTIPVTDFRLLRLIIRNPTLNIELPDGMIPGPQMMLLLKEGATVIIEGDANNPLLATVKSDDKEIDDFEIFRAKDKYLESERWEYVKKMFSDSKNATLKKELNAKIDVLDSSRLAWQKEFVNKYSDTYAALEVFSMYYTMIDNAEARSAYNSLADTYKNTSLSKSIKEQLDGVAVTSAGQQLIPFKQEGIDGKIVDIKALKGKYVLIDFWGSWCGPCRESHPHLAEIYRKYKSKGLEIIGVAYENGEKKKQQEVWKKAVKEDKMNWLQILNDPARTDIVKLYGISAFPTKVLADRNGKIILRVIDGAKELDKKLSEIFPE